MGTYSELKVRKILVGDYNKSILQTKTNRRYPLHLFSRLGYSCHSEMLIYLHVQIKEHKNSHNYVQRTGLHVAFVMHNTRPTRRLQITITTRFRWCDNSIFSIKQ